MFDRLRQALGGMPPESSYVECRRCGTRLRDENDTCGYCESTDVAQYDL